jgi:Protein of unknown function (DUF4242)
VKFLAEAYLPAPSEPELKRLNARIRAAVDELASGGTALRYVETIVVPEDEMCLLVYEADTPELVRAASERAGIPCERVMEAT